MAALAELSAASCNAAVIFLGNFGPEGPETMLAQKFSGPTMFVAAAEENTAMLASSRGDAYCGMLNASYNLGLRGVKAYIPEYPVGDAKEIAAMIAEFMPVARMLIGLKNLKIITFGPRPYDFLACNAPIKPLFTLASRSRRTPSWTCSPPSMTHRRHAHPCVVADMAEELGAGNKMPGILPRLAQYELTLIDWVEKNMGASEVCGLCQQVLACVPDAVWLRALLCQLPPRRRAASRSPAKWTSTAR